MTDATNRNSINIEICVNQDGDYSKARLNCIELVKYLIKTMGIPAENVIRHFDAKGKYCPRKMMDNPELWAEFKRMISVPMEDEQVAPIDEMMKPLPRYAEVVTRCDPLRLRYKPDGIVIAKMPKGSVVEVLNTDGEWWKVKFGSVEGFAHSDYLDADKKGYTEKDCWGVCTGNGVRLRSAPNFGDNIIGMLYVGDSVQIISTNGCWTSVKVGGKIGFMYSEYVRR